MDDYKDLAAVRPGNPYYNANVRRYIAGWKKYWSEYIPQMMASKRVPDGATWGGILNLSSSVSSKASEVYNVMVHSFTPASFKGIIFLSTAKMVEADQGANYGAEMSALANCWKAKFGGEDTYFFYTTPSKALAPKVTAPKSIKGKSTAVEITDWSDVKQIQGLIDLVVNVTCKERK
jgi:hypothetical protein